MSENETQKKPETKEACEEAGGTWNPETNTCKLPEPEEKGYAQRLLQLEKAIHDLKTNNISHETAQSREERLASIIKDVNEKNDQQMQEVLKAHTKAQDAKFAALLAEKDMQDESVLRQYLGVPKDVALKASDIPAIVVHLRKAMLENQENRSPTGKPLEKGNPDGTAKKDPFDEAVKKKFEEMS